MRISLVVLQLVFCAAFCAEVTVGDPETSGCNPMGIG